MTGTKYMGMDVHKESISIAVMNGFGKVVMESVIETKANTILQFTDGLRGELYVTFEEGTWAAWLYDLLKAHARKVVVCDPRRNALLKDGNKSDRINARKLAELLYLDKLHPIYHGEHGLRTLKELVRSYLTLTNDLGRVMTQMKAIYRVLPSHWRFLQRWLFGTLGSTSKPRSSVRRSSSAWQIWNRQKKFLQEHGRAGNCLKRNALAVPRGADANRLQSLVGFTVLFFLK
jgi:hypothetical protein